MRFSAACIASLLSGLAVAGSLAHAQSGGQSGTGTATAGTTATPTGTTPSGPPTGSAEQQTHPVVHSRHPTRRSHLRVEFTLSDQPGHAGVSQTAYLLDVQPPTRSRPACGAPAPPTVTSGTQGQRTAVQLPAPPHGWCRGTYTVTVELQRGPYCPAPQDGQPPQPCPEFATQNLDVGRARAVIRRPPR